MKSYDEVRFVKVNQNALLDFLNKAKTKIVIAKAGYRIEEVDALLNIHQKGINCNVFIDPDENAVRWGFGDITSIQKLRDYCDILNVQTADHIRMSVVIVDDNALIYTPVALSWEKEPDKISFPNGFIGGAHIAESLLKQMNIHIDEKESESGVKNEDETKEITHEDQYKEHKEDEVKPPQRIDNVIPFPGCTVPNKTSDENQKELDKTIFKLKKNPPVDPSKLRKVTIYQNNYKVLKHQIKGIKVNNKSVSLRPFNSLFPNLNKQLKASWRVFTKEDIDEIYEISIFEKETHFIIEKYTLDVGRFGKLIKVENKSKFENEIKKEKEEFLEILKLKPNDNPKNEKSKYIQTNSQKESASDTTKSRKNLGCFLEQSKKKLSEYMQQMIQENQEAIDMLFKNDKTLLNKIKSKQITIDETLPDVLNTFIQDKIKFPIADELIERMDLVFDYYDVSNEMLYDDDEFKQILSRIKQNKDDIKIRQFADAFQEDLS